MKEEVLGKGWRDQVKEKEDQVTEKEREKNECIAEMNPSQNKDTDMEKVKNKKDELEHWALSRGVIKSAIIKDDRKKNEISNQVKDMKSIFIKENLERCKDEDIIIPLLTVIDETNSNDMCTFSIKEREGEQDRNIFRCDKIQPSSYFINGKYDNKPMAQLQYTEEEWKMLDGKNGSTKALYHRQKFFNEYDHKTLLENLRPEFQEIYIDNPHLRQVFANSYTFYRRSADFPFSYEDRVLTPEKERTKYRSRRFEAKTVEHWGQRKLFLSEIEFLTLYSYPGDYVIYAGAAPGSHVNFLAESLFPSLHFILIDPAPFDAYEVIDDARIPTNGSVKIIQDFFTDDMAKTYFEELVSKSSSSSSSCSKAFRVLFISDVRRIESGMEEDEKEDTIIQDMRMQEKWVELLQPNYSLLKFRLPYNVREHPIFQYLDGEILFPVWAPQTSSESRLLVTKLPNTKGKPFKYKEYDVADYESAMFHFNTASRVTYFPTTQSTEGFDHCYDCSAEIFILNKFFCKYFHKKTMDINKQSKARMDERNIDVMKSVVNAASLCISKSTGKTRKSLGIKESDQILNWRSNRSINLSSTPRNKRGLLPLPAKVEGKNLVKDGKCQHIGENRNGDIHINHRDKTRVYTDKKEEDNVDAKEGPPLKKRRSLKKIRKSQDSLP